MKLKELLKKIDNREMLNIYNKEKDCIGRMEPENARKYLSILLLESEVDVMKTSAREKETEEKEPDDQMEEAANRLQHEASVKCSRELEKAQKYKEGYTQGVEDLLRCIRRGE